MCGKHICRIQKLIQLFFAQDAMLQDEVIDALTCLECFLGNLCGCLVSDDRIECCNDTDGVFDRLQIVLAVDGYAINTFLSEYSHDISGTFSQKHERPRIQRGV